MLCFFRHFHCPLNLTVQLTTDLHCRNKVASMRFFNNCVGGAEQRDKDTDLRSSSVRHSRKPEGEQGSPNTNVIWVHNPLAQLINTDSGTDMPAATLGSSQHPSNEECGIRDVWAHNLEDEFRTIRQVIYSLLCLTTFNHCNNNNYNES